MSAAEQLNRVDTTRAAESSSKPPEEGGLQRLNKIFGEARMAAYDAESLAGLLDGLHMSGFEDASVANSAWQKRWWSQVGYIASTLESLATGLQAQNDEIEGLLRDLRLGRLSL